MFKFILNNTKNIFLFSLVTTALYALGNAINSKITWTYLEQFFHIIQSCIKLFDFMVNTNQLFLAINFSFLIFVAFWSFKGVWLIIKFFKN